MEDPIEKIIKEALDHAGISYSQDSAVGLDFYIPAHQIYIECKQFHTPRISEQISRVSDVIVVQGKRAATILAAWIAIGGIAEAADKSYCSLWAREMVRIELRQGVQYDLEYVGEDLRFTFLGAGPRTAQPILLERRASNLYQTCRALDPGTRPPLPATPEATTEGWSRATSELSLVWQGSAAAIDPTEGSGLSGFSAGSPEWLDWCRANYRTWRESDQTVVRRGSGGRRVPCPG